jgi:hypothetical protein
MNRRKLSAGLVVGAMALLGLGVTGGVAHAAPPALPAPSIFTLPLPVPLAVTVTTGPGGAITDVSVDPADITVTKARPGKVSFTTDTDGVKVSIKSKGQTQSMSARAGSLDAFINAAGGSWAGEVFPGAPAQMGSVAYVIGGSPDAPTITVGAITGNGVAGTPETSTDEDGVSTRVVVTFTNATKTQTRDLTIRVKVENETDDDDDDDSSSEGSASLRVTLGKIRGVAGAEVAGPKTWGGILCDGTAGTITYDVAADGTISNVVANVKGAPVADAKIKAEGGRAEVRFPTGERVKISVKVEGAGLTIDVSEKIRCDANDPTINGDPAVVADDGDDDHSDDHDGDHHGGGDQGGQGGHHGGDDKKSDD